MLNRAISRGYDKGMFAPLASEYYGQSDFFNFGYWLGDTRNQKEACENLMERLLAFLPEKRGYILDVACGMGASTRHLRKYYDASSIMGINISTRQLERSRVNAPGCEFLLIDAARLAFQDSKFDNIICIEAAFHFNTREKFIHETYRVLKPGGRLILSDILLSRPLQRGGWLPRKSPGQNLAMYRDLYLRAGFQDVKVVEATVECWKGFRRHLLRLSLKKFLTGDLGIRGFIGVAFLLVRIIALTIRIRHYVLVSAKKP